MRRLIRALVVIAAVGFVLRRLKQSVVFGTVVLDDAVLSKRLAEPLDLIVVGMAMISSGTSAELAASAIRRLRILGLLEADADVVQALSGRVTAFGAIHTRD